MKYMSESLNPVWRCIGPFRAGRVGAVAGDCQDPNVFYFGACAGGIWKSEDAGLYWQNVSDGYFTSSSIGAIAVAESDGNVIYVGTGESTARSNISPGDGVYKSTDAGRSWRHIGLKESRHIGKIAIHPDNPDLVYIAALGHVHGPNEERGVYRSSDGGETWEQVLYLNDQVGAVDIKLDPRNPRILYAAMWEMTRSFWDVSSGSDDCGLYRSTDGGDSWQEVTGRNGLPGGLLGKIAVAISPAQAGRVWALIESPDRPGLYRTDDFGNQWKLVSEDGELNARAWYYTHMTADPQDGNTVYVNCFNLWKSIDGGHNFTQISTPHGDNHDIWLDPHNNQRIIQGNDGGACVSLNGGRSWSPVYNQPTAQLYRINTDNQYPYHVYGTQQDSSTIAVPSNDYKRGAISWASSYQVGTGESGHIAPRPDDHNIVYSGAIGSSPGGGNSLQHYDHRTRQIRLITPWPETRRGELPSVYRYRFNWTYPIVVSEHDPETIYIAGQHVLRSQDAGQSWQEISPDLTRNDPAAHVVSGGPINKEGGTAEMYATILALAESPLDANVLWAGSDDGLIHLSQDGGESWQNVTPAVLPEFLQISTVEPSPFARGTVYVAGTRNKADDFQPYLFVSEDFGVSWTQITAGIPADDFTRVIRADSERPGLLYAGTESTVYYSTDNGTSWRRLSGNLPVTPIYDLRVKNGDLVAGTHGRSLWIMDDVSPLRQLADDAADEVVLFAPREAVRIIPQLTIGWAGGAPGKNYYPVFADNTTFVEVDSGQGSKARRFLDAGDNAPAGALIHYHLPDSATGPLTLTITDANGDEVNQFQNKDDEWTEGTFLPNKAGHNRFVWDLRYPDGTTIKGEDLAATVPVGPMVAPGEYTIQLEHDGQIVTQPLTVIAEPSVTVDALDSDAQVQLLLAIRDKLSEANAVVNALRDIRAQLAGAASRLPANEAIVALADGWETRLKAAESPLTPVDLRRRPDVTNAGVRAISQLAALTPVVDSADFRPTDAAQRFFTEKSAEMDKLLETARTEIDQAVSEMNAALHAAGTGGIIAAG